MSSYFLRLRFSEIALVQANPVLWTCVEFSGCSYWQTSTKIAWNLPANTFVTFFESEKCNSRGEFHFISDWKDTSDNRVPVSGHFRSMMVSNYSHPQPSIKYVSNCPSEDASLDDSTLDLTESSGSAAWGDLAGDAGRSSNWNDSLAGF